MTAKHYFRKTKDSRKVISHHYYVKTFILLSSCVKSSANVYVYPSCVFWIKVITFELRNIFVSPGVTWIYFKRLFEIVGALLKRMSAKWFCEICSRQRTRIWVGGILAQWVELRCEKAYYYISFMLLLFHITAHAPL